LDTPFTSLGGSGKAGTRRQELKACLRRIVSAAADEKADFLLVCGDLYEHGYTGKATINFVADEFRRIPETRVILIPGNHDPYTGNSYYRSFQWPENVHILAGDNSFAVFEDVQACVYAQAGIQKLQPEQKPGFPELVKPDYFNILLVHGTLDMGFSKDAWNPLESSVLESLGMDYVAMGHFHSNLQGAGRKGNIYNPGSPEAMGFDEMGKHGIFIGTLSQSDSGDKTCNIRFLSLNSRNCIKLEVNIDECSTEEQVIQRTLEKMRSSGSSRDLYEIRLKGYTEGDLKIDTAYIAGNLSEDAFFARIIDESAPGIDFEEIACEPGLRGLFTRKMLNRIKSAATEKEKQLAQKALIYGLQAMDSGHPEI
jgi:DNA repair exonuclease SbcCD nuclease subunit